MKTRKRLSCFFLTLFMLFTLVVPAFADELTTANTVSLTQRESYAYEAMKRYVIIHALGKELKMTQPIPICNGAENVWNYFLFDDSECIGMMTVAWVEGAFASSFCAGNYDAVESLLVESAPFSLAAKGDSLLLISGDTVTVLEGSTVLLSAGEADITFADTQVQVMTLKSVDLTEEEISAKSTSYLLNVPIVANDYSPDTGEGICWAAAMASIIRCRTNSYSFLTAVGLYNILDNTYNMAITNPHANAVWLSRCLDCFDLPHSVFGAGTTYAGVQNIIENQGRPIYAGLRANLTTAHAVVIAGFTKIGDCYYYRIMDPNRSYLVSVEVTDTSATNFTYVTSSTVTYTKWFRRIH